VTVDHEDSRVIRRFRPNGGYAGPQHSLCAVIVIFQADMEHGQSHGFWNHVRRPYLRLLTVAMIIIVDYFSGQEHATLQGYCTWRSDDVGRKRER